MTMISEKELTRERRAAYQMAWENILKALYGWSASKVRGWIKESGYLDKLSDEKSMLYHRPPHYWVINSIVQDEAIADLSGPTKADLIQSLMRVMRDDRNFVFPNTPGFNDMRQRVNGVLKPYKAKLPRYSRIVTMPSLGSQSMRRPNFAATKSYRLLESERPRVTRSLARQGRRPSTRLRTP